MRVSNWTSIGTAVATQDLRQFKLPIGKNSSWIQFKIIMFFTSQTLNENEFEKLIILSSPQLKVV